MTLTFTHANSEDGAEAITLFYQGRIYLALNDHPNFEKILGACNASRNDSSIDADDIVPLFDVAETVERKFAQLTERVAVRGGTLLLDGDPVDGTLQEQILEFLDNDEDFGPLVAFYEKLLTNPLGDVRAGLYDWIRGQRANGNFTITPDGDILGYKSVKQTDPEWRTDELQVFVPSRRGPGIVNGREVTRHEYIEQVEGDVVEMPRSRVLHAPSLACADGLHVGTYAYASTFYGGDTVMLVRFSPRDIVSLPDSNATWKLRVCRYTVVETVTEPLDVPVYLQNEDEPEDDGEFWGFCPDEGDEPAEGDETPDVALDAPLREGERVVDVDGDEGTVVAEADEDDDVLVQFDGYPDGSPLYVAASSTRRIHGKGGPTSQAAKGSGRNPAQDAHGRFSQGRPGSRRDSDTGRFSG